ncbi:aconitase family protein [Xylariales sp. PMI_506]|nr:aconitase family protein [Xylariales sp. PMI_506]
MLSTTTDNEETAGRITQLLRDSRGVEFSALLKSPHSRESDALQDAHWHCTTPPHLGGMGLKPGDSLIDQQVEEVLFMISAYLEALNYQDRTASPATELNQRPPGRRGMTLAEKILAAHDVSGRGEVKPGDVIRLHVDWVIASELSWAGLSKTYHDSLDSPGIFRNDRLWIAGDHVVDPRVMKHPRIKPLVEASERARRVFKLTEYPGMNYTIMHTEFCRERAQPGMLIIGADSHTCSAGSVSSLAIGLGVADVTLPLVTGQTWIKVPETVEIRFINKPKPGLSGKDVILYVLKQLKRNTVAAERIVEYTGPGLRHLSVDARFAFCNMTTEFGGITGICVPDEITKEFIDGRRNRKHKKETRYYKPDEDAEYAATYIIDLDEVEPFIARYPKPDDVIPVSELAGTALDGCFIGACTTAREDLILAALILEAGLKQGLQPADHGKRKVVPGSRPILHELEELGLNDIYRRAGYEIGVPGCSYCVGMSADKAGEGEVWLSSQNRNFENRMGPGAIGHVTSAVTVAASSFAMMITDPKDLLEALDFERLQNILYSSSRSLKTPSTLIRYVEPGIRETCPVGTLPTSNDRIHQAEKPETSSSLLDPTVSPKGRIIRGRVQTLGDFIDTDALAPAEALVGNVSPEEIGKFCLYHTHPDFRRRAMEEGLNIVVAGRAFGVGSSRDNAVSALLGTGVQCVIARSFAFIYARNQPNLGLLGIVMEDEEFYKLAAHDRVCLEIDVDRRVIVVGIKEESKDDSGNRRRTKEFPFTLSDLEMQLWQQGGMSAAFRKWGKDILERITAPGKPSSREPLLNRASTDNMSW